ncbi:MAG: hypothetical protein AAFN70_11025, partial [Planctomycetota bacterium]
FACLAAILFPLDLLGGFLLPNRWRPNTISLVSFGAGWIRGVLTQGTLFLAASLLILFTGRQFGVVGAALAITAIAIVLVGSQLQIAKFVGALNTNARKQSDKPSTLQQAQSLVSEWEWKSRPITVLGHHDTGFAGGVVGLPGIETVVLPASTLMKLSAE